jgi:hypothetical protein
MSEVDRLSNSGLYPALPLGDKRQSRDQPDAKRSGDKPAAQSKRDDAAKAQSDAPRDPKSQIDEYA